MLTWVINRGLNGEETPQQWKVAYISSIHKKGSKKFVLTVGAFRDERDE